ncbi:MAG: PIG-L family deacetylase [Phycisphaerae bacterium]|jgi:LmbE family N-acetylglucosaminyl deacetylase|nr:PIG-L family deacetylase [Phycisphaerae bacterium]
MAARVFAIAAHPDDIEFGMAGTLVLLARAGCEIHYMNIANGSCGSATHDAEATAEIRLIEAKKAARRLGAVFHRPLVADLEIFYEPKLLARVASIMRAVAPDILLVPSPQDYIEDHENACRLAVTAAFCRGMRNFPVDPPKAPVEGDVVIYHAQPHGGRDSMNNLIRPDFFIDISSAIDEKADMLAEHKSQSDWLDHTQSMGAYLETMKSFAAEMGAMSTKCDLAEGWRKHNPLGFRPADADPLANLLGEYVVGF